MSLFPGVFFASSYRGYFHDSLKRLQNYVDPCYLDILPCILDAPPLSMSATTSAYDKYSIICPFNAPNVLDPGFLGFLSDSIIQDLNNDLCRIFFDNSNEKCSESIIHSLLLSLAERGVSNLRAINLICQDRALPGKTDIRVYSHDFFIVRCIDSLMADILPRFSPLQKPSYLFLCLNATPRPLRVWTLLELMKSGLWGPSTSKSQCLVSFPGFEYCKESGLDIVLLHKALIRHGFDDPQAYILWLSKNAPFVVDNTSRLGNDLADVVDPDVYRDTLCSIVTETECHPSAIRVTEKTIKAFAMGHLPIVVGNRSSLDLVGQFGFETFDGYVDESYDSISEMPQRIRSVIDNAVRLSQRLEKDESLICSIREIGMANKAWALKDFHSNYASRWTNPILDAISSWE